MPRKSKAVRDAEAAAAAAAAAAAITEAAETGQWVQLDIQNLPPKTASARKVLDDTSEVDTDALSQRRREFYDSVRQAVSRMTGVDSNSIGVNYRPAYLGYIIKTGKKGNLGMPKQKVKLHP